MSRSLKFLTVSYILAAALMFVPSALATTRNGEGIWGPTNDVMVVYVMFIIMGILILIMIVFSVIQTLLDRRHHAKLDSGKHAAGH